MKVALQKIGVLAWWLVLPGLIVYLHGRPRTRVLIRHGGNIVVVKGWLGNGKWMLPGGGLKRGEDPARGALREVREETGLRLEPASLRLLMRAQYRDHGISFPCHYFVANLAQQLPPRPELLEISAAEWVDGTLLNTRNSNPDVLAVAHSGGTDTPS